MAGTVERRHELAALIPPEEERDKVQQLLAAFEDDATVRRNLYDYLNHYELLATGVNTEVLDIDVVNRHSGGAIVRIYATYAELIHEIRTRLQRDTMYEELQTLATTISGMRGIALPVIGVGHPPEPPPAP